MIRMWYVVLLFSQILWGSVTVHAVQKRGATIVIRTVKPDTSGINMTRYGVTREDVRRLEATLPNVQSFVPVRKHPDADIQVGDKIVRSIIVGTSEKYQRLRDVEILRGRFLTSDDNRQRQNVAVISREQALKLFGRKDPIGRTIRFRQNVFTVVGVAKAREALAVLIPWETMRTQLGDQVVLRKSGSFEATHYELSEVWLNMASVGDAQLALPIVRKTLEKYHDQNDFEVGLE